MPLKKRPDVLDGTTTRVKMDCGSLYLTLNKDGKEKQELIEVRFGVGKSGHCATALLECIGRITSALLQTELERDEVERIIKNNMLGFSCGTRFKMEDKEHLSCIDFAAHLILSALKEETKEPNKDDKKEDATKEVKEVKKD